MNDELRSELRRFFIQRKALNRAEREKGIIGKLSPYLKVRRRPVLLSVFVASLSLSSPSASASASASSAFSSVFAVSSSSSSSVSSYVFIVSSSSSPASSSREIRAAPDG